MQDLDGTKIDKGFSLVDHCQRMIVLLEMVINQKVDYKEKMDKERARGPLPDLYTQATNKTISEFLGLNIVELKKIKQDLEFGIEKAKNSKS